MAYLRAIPNLSIAMPRDVHEMRAMLKAALRIGGPKAVRWPRGGVDAAPPAPVSDWDDIAWGSWQVVKEPAASVPGQEPVWLLGIGPTVDYALTAAAGRPDVGVINARFVKPLDEVLLHGVAARARALVTIEDHTVVGGLGTAVLESLTNAGITAHVKLLGVRDVIVPHGDPAAQHEELGYGPRAIAALLDEMRAPEYEQQAAVGGGVVR